MQYAFSQLNYLIKYAFSSSKLLYIVAPTWAHVVQISKFYMLGRQKVIDTKIRHSEDTKSGHCCSEVNRTMVAAAPVVFMATAKKAQQ